MGVECRFGGLVGGSEGREYRKTCCGTAGMDELCREVVLERLFESVLAGRCDTRPRRRARGKSACRD